MDGTVGRRPGHRCRRTVGARRRGPLPHVVVVALAPVAVLAGCAAPPQVPNPFPPRPADLGVTALRACEAVDARDSALLGITDRTPDPFGQGANNCVLTGPDGQVWTVRIQPGIPARHRVPGDPGYLDGDLRLAGQRVTSVEGYGAVEGVGEGMAPGATCAVVVDTDPDVSLVVTYESYADPAGPPAAGSRDVACARASRVASMVVASARDRDRA